MIKDGARKLSSRAVGRIDNCNPESRKHTVVSQNIPSVLRKEYYIPLQPKAKRYTTRIASIHHIKFIIEPCPDCISKRTDRMLEPG